MTEINPVCNKCGKPIVYSDKYGMFCEDKCGYTTSRMTYNVSEIIATALLKIQENYPKLTKKFVELVLKTSSSGKLEDLTINQDKFDPGNTKVLFNQELTSISLEYGMVREGLSIQNFKKTFGRQLKTWCGGSENRRFYVWTFRLKDTVLYALVHNVKGVCWEYPVKTRQDNLMDIIHIVYKYLPRR